MRIQKSEIIKLMNRFYSHLHHDSNNEKERLKLLLDIQRFKEVEPWGWQEDDFYTPGEGMTRINPMDYFIHIGALDAAELLFTHPHHGAPSVYKKQIEKTARLWIECMPLNGWIGENAQKIYPVSGTYPSLDGAIVIELLLNFNPYVAELNLAQKLALQRQFLECAEQMDQSDLVKMMLKKITHPNDKRMPIGSEFIDFLIENEYIESRTNNINTGNIPIQQELDFGDDFKLENLQKIKPKQ